MSRDGIMKGVALSRLASRLFADWEQAKTAMEKLAGLGLDYTAIATKEHYMVVWAKPMLDTTKMGVDTTVFEDYTAWFIERQVADEQGMGGWTYGEACYQVDVAGPTLSLYADPLKGLDTPGALIIIRRIDVQPAIMLAAVSVAHSRPVDIEAMMVTHALSR